MGQIQNAVMKVVGGAMAGRLLKEKMEQANKNVEDVKMAKLKQRAMREKYKAQIEKSKLARIQAKQKTVELKQKKEKVSIAGAEVKDPALLAKIKEANK